MKLFISIFIILLGIGCQTAEPERIVADGLYIVTKIDTVETDLSPLSPNEHAIIFSKMFEEYNSEEFIRLVIDTSDFVPLDLENAPEMVPQTDTKKKLLLTLTNLASEKLKTFTADHVMEHAAIVVDGEALTMHKIREAITGGKLQIIRCNDNACETLFVKLKDNEK